MDGSWFPSPRLLFIPLLMVSLHLFCWGGLYRPIHSACALWKHHWVASGNVKCEGWGCICWVGRAQGETSVENAVSLMHHVETSSTIIFKNGGQVITSNSTKVLWMAELMCIIISLMPTGLYLWALQILLLQQCERPIIVGWPCKNAAVGLCKVSQLYNTPDH